MSSIPPPTIEVTPNVLWLISAAMMIVAGMLFSSIAFAAGIRAFDTLFCLFVIGAAGTQLALIAFYLLNARKQQS